MYSMCVMYCAVIRVMCWVVYAGIGERRTSGGLLYYLCLIPLKESLPEPKDNMVCRKPQ